MQPLFDNSSTQIRHYAFSEHNWHDYEAHGRSVRHGDYLLLKNFRTKQPWQGPADSVRSPSHVSLLEARDVSALNAAQEDVFLEPRPDVELYNLKDDPYQLRNLAGVAEVASVQSDLTAVLDRWMDETGDSVPEVISPDTFHRETGKALPKSKIDSSNAITPGQDRNADRVNAPGPR